MFTAPSPSWCKDGYEDQNRIIPLHFDETCVMLVARVILVRLEL
ncbi:unnamed protein product [Rhodiola kirilowii]